VSDPPPEIPKVTIRNFSIAVQRRAIELRCVGAGLAQNAYAPPARQGVAPSRLPAVGPVRGPTDYEREAVQRAREMYQVRVGIPAILRGSDGAGLVTTVLV
jgi:hypothetical protein